MSWSRGSGTWDSSNDSMLARGSFRDIQQTGTSVCLPAFLRKLTGHYENNPLLQHVLSVFFLTRAVFQASKDRHDHCYQHPHSLFSRRFQLPHSRAYTTMDCLFLPLDLFLLSEDELRAH